MVVLVYVCGRGGWGQGMGGGYVYTCVCVCVCLSFSSFFVNYCVGEWKGGEGLLNEWDGLWLDDDHNDVVQIGSNKQHVFFRL